MSVGLSNLPGAVAPAHGAPAGTPRLLRRDGAARNVHVLGIRVTDARMDAAIAILEDLIAASEGRTRAAFIVNAHTLNLACESAAYRAVLNEADVVFGDGIGVRIAARLRGVRLMDNLVGTDLLPAFFAATGARHGYYLLGGQAGTAARAAATLERRFPAIRIAGTHDGFFDHADTARVIRLINDARPDMLLVAMGNPRQEQWIHRHLPALEVPLAIGVGGLFDHWAGNLQRAPRWMRRLGLEWLQILMQQPHKWQRYLLGNPKFLVRAARDRLR